MTREQNINRYIFYGMYMILYYKESIVVCVKGQPQLFTKTLSLLTSIDLSANNLHGELPEGITKLAGLLVLNLSRNQISGQIPKSISELHQLSSLDLSNNRLSGAIPSSMSSLSFLGSLNLSDNTLSGEIPYAGHMTTFEASSFGGNPGLCGSPLGVKCPGDESYHGGTAKDDNNEEAVDKWFYLSIGLGFAAGILVPYFVLAIKRPWSNAYFNLVDKIVDRIACVESIVWLPVGIRVWN